MWPSQHASFYLIFWSRRKGNCEQPAMLSLAHAIEARAWWCYCGSVNLQRRCLSSLPLLPPVDPPAPLWASSLAFRQRLGDPWRNGKSCSSSKNGQSLQLCWTYQNIILLLFAWKSYFVYCRIRVMGMFTQWYAMIMV